MALLIRPVLCLSCARMDCAHLDLPAMITRTGVPAAAVEGGAAERGKLIHLRRRHRGRRHARQQHELRGAAQPVHPAVRHAVRHVRLCVLQVRALRLALFKANSQEGPRAESCLSITSDSASFELVVVHPSSTIWQSTPAQLPGTHLRPCGCRSGDAWSGRGQKQVV